MCGIAGYINLKKFPQKKFQKIISKMLKVSQHRGPDETKNIIGNNYAFGTNRLSIQTIKYGQQPIENSNYVVGFNGEIFNFFQNKRTI